ncbi:MAG: translation initiation factor IF-2 [Candidatus Firestonebacteria bacterium]|nr:translation initiation factor IF-2 [Candidatus Firestonebacteria bacterium]
MNQKVRVFELAKDLKLTSKELVGELKKMRIEVKSHMSVLEDETVAYIKRLWGEDDMTEDIMVPGMMAPEAPVAAVKAEPAVITPLEVEPEPEPVAVPEPERPVLPAEYIEEPKSRKESKQAVKPEAPVAPPVVVPPTPLEDLPALKMPSSATVGEAAEKLGVKATELIKKLMGLGVFATINQRLDTDTLEVLLVEFGYRLEIEEMYGEDILALEEEQDRPEDLTPRPPVVTIMGHVNHGKTSLLDAIRSTHVMDREAGGITQHIGAYQVQLPKGNVTFLDTPGHEAFTALRARGAQLTDVVVLVVAADDGVQPQTIEAINHAKAANVPIIVAINKIDKPGVTTERIKQELANYNLLPEEWGGKTIIAEISAKKNIGIDNLLDLILLEAEMLELKANSKTLAKGVVIEAKLDRGRGAVASLLIQKGTLRVGDAFVTGVQFGRVRALNNDHGKAVESAGPGVPVELLGISGVPSAGDAFQVVASDKLARQIAMKRQMIKREQDLRKTHRITLDNLNTQIAEGQLKELKIIIKADVQGSAEVLKQSLEAISTDKVKLTCIHNGVGNITESDVLLASASNAIVIGFTVKPETGVENAAKREEVDVRIYKVIYEAVEDVRAAMEGLLEPHYHEVPTGRADVKTAFKLSSGLVTAGSQVASGKILRGSQAKVIRDGKILHTGKIESLRRFKDDVKEVSTGMECGIVLAGFTDYQAGDVIDAFQLEEVAQKL